MKRYLIAAAAALCLTATAAHATDVTVGQADGFNNCAPFACSLSIGFDVQQQIYAASQFTAGPMEIGAISFYRDDRASSANPLMDNQSFELAFYYTSRNVATTANGGPKSDDLSSNLGALLSNFGTFSVSGALPSVLTFTGNAFTYDPTLGNLILQITPLSGGSTAWTGGAFFQADSRGTATRRVVGPSQFGNGPIALVTTFSSPTAIAPVPEPATWALMLGGFGLAGAALRRRKLAV